jgi:Cytochrome oxidase complex assembly protein 1
MSRARSNPAVIEALGSPIEDGWFWTGSVEVTARSGTADLEIPVSGPKGAGAIYVAGAKVAGVWTYSRLNIKLDGNGQTVDLPAASH